LYAKVFIALWSEPGVTTAHPLENSQKQTNIRISEGVEALVSVIKVI